MTHSEFPLVDCRRCPRLVSHHNSVRERWPDYHARPVGAWGAAKARMLLVGLAPGLHGACRTGKAFVGDSSGDFLFAALHACGLSSSPDPAQARLEDVRITNIVKCLPPGNAPKATEIANCRSHLQSECEQMRLTGARQNKAVVALGGSAYRGLGRALGVRLPPFGHGVTAMLNARVMILGSFHPSRLNVNTRRLTAPMLQDVLQAGAKFVRG